MIRRSDPASEAAEGAGDRRGDNNGGGMEVNKNRWIEDWNAARENLEIKFRWTRRNLAIVGIFGVAVPILVYKASSANSICKMRTLGGLTGSSSEDDGNGRKFDLPITLQKNLSYNILHQVSVLLLLFLFVLIAPKKEVTVESSSNRS
uniref:Uncharacterized protein n=1 Tax=Ananas comosus var. bracteatus TaxID=296719 RepID=A0A6V7PT51_ANACO|nr:unnamed protein product [Ananas comosus var. bracteatus]